MRVYPSRAIFKRTVASQWPYGYSDLTLRYLTAFRLLVGQKVKSGYSSGYSKRPFDPISFGYLLGFLEEYFWLQSQKWDWVKIAFNKAYDPATVAQAVKVFAEGQEIEVAISYVPPKQHSDCDSGLNYRNQRYYDLGSGVIYPWIPNASLITPTPAGIQYTA